MAPAPAENPATPFVEMVGMAMSGDPVMMRAMMASVSTFSVRLLVALLILAVTLWLAGKLAGLADKAISRMPHGRRPIDRTLAIFISALVRYVVVAVGLIAVLQQLGVQTTSVLAVLGAASLAIGLALQGTLGNVAAGVMLLIQRPYRVGDRVELNGRQGKVVRMDLFNTVVMDYDGALLFLPNGKVFGDMIVNFSRQNKRRIELTFGVAFEDDLDLALETMIAVACADPRVRGDPAPWAKVSGIADLNVKVMLRCWTTPDDWVDVNYDLIKAVKEAFDREGLTFPHLAPPTPAAQEARKPQSLGSRRRKPTQRSAPPAETAALAARPKIARKRTTPTA